MLVSGEIVLNLNVCCFIKIDNQKLFLALVISMHMVQSFETIGKKKRSMSAECRAVPKTPKFMVTLVYYCYMTEVARN